MSYCEQLIIFLENSGEGSRKRNSKVNLEGSSGGRLYEEEDLTSEEGAEQAAAAVAAQCTAAAIEERSPQLGMKKAAAMAEGAPADLVPALGDRGQGCGENVPGGDSSGEWGSRGRRGVRGGMRKQYWKGIWLVVDEPLEESSGTKSSE